MTDVIVESADGQIYEFTINLDPQSDAMLLETTAKGAIRAKELFPRGTRLKVRFRTPKFDSDEDNEDDPVKWYMIVRGTDIEGKPETFRAQTPMIKSANKTASARMIKEALVLHRGDVQKAADWVSKKKQKE
jgi:hypothetical protein